MDIEQLYMIIDLVVDTLHHGLRRRLDDVHEPISTRCEITETTNYHDEVNKASEDNSSFVEGLRSRFSVDNHMRGDHDLISMT